MSAPIRFLGFAIVSYVGLRTASSALAIEPLPQALAEPARQAEVATLPPGVPADMGPQPIMPAQAYPAAYAGTPYPTQAMMMPYAVPPMMAAAMQRGMMRPMAYPAPYYYVPQQPGAAPADLPPPPAAESNFAPTGYEGPAPSLDQWPTIGMAGPYSVPQMQRTRRWGSSKETNEGDALALARPDRWSVDTWALVRPPREGLYSVTDPDLGINPGLASNGTLGGSQAGMRINWRPVGRLGVHLRASTALMPRGRGGQAFAGGEGAAGVSWQPLGAIPVRLLAERRQRFGQALGGGRNAFAFLAEGGLYDRPLPYGFRLDGYGQAGLVGLQSRDLFADGAFTATRPILPRLALGGGMWGGVQPGLSRVDAGPRLSYQLSPALRVHLDYRFRLTGRANPPSGPALTLTGGF